MLKLSCEYKPPKVKLQENRNIIPKYILHRNRAKERRETVSREICPNEYKVAKYLWQHLPSRQTTIYNLQMDYFVASRAVDILMVSPFFDDNPSCSKGNSLFATREEVTDYLDTMLLHKFFHRTQKICLPVSGPCRRRRLDDCKTAIAKKRVKPLVDCCRTEVCQEAIATAEEICCNEPGIRKPEQKQFIEVMRRKKRFRLDWHNEQVFMDRTEMHVWLYNPLTAGRIAMLFLTVLFLVLLAAYPFVPTRFSCYVSYLALTAIGVALVFILLHVVQGIVFVLVWLVSTGRRHFWLLPNINKDVGPIASFFPIFWTEIRVPCGKFAHLSCSQAQLRLRQAESQLESERVAKKRDAPITDDEVIDRVVKLNDEEDDRLRKRFLVKASRCPHKMVPDDYRSNEQRGMCLDPKMEGASSFLSGVCTLPTREFTRC